MAYEPTGVMTMYPVYLSRLMAEGETREAYDIGVAQNETNLNQNFETIFQKLIEIEACLTGLE